jgi:vacuolar protein sorting-associated protein 11
VELITDPKITTLFVATTERVVKLGISKKGQGLPPKTVDDSGCGAGCMTIDKKTGSIVVARDDAIYYYTMDGKGRPRAHESSKSLISIHGEYVAIVCPPSANSSAKEPDPVRRRFGGAADALLNANSFILLETELRVIAYTETLISPVKGIFHIWGDLHVLTQDGKVRIPFHPFQFYVCVLI